MVKIIGKRNIRHSLIHKQVVYFMLVALSIILIFGTYFFFYARGTIVHRTYDQLTAIRETKKNQTEYFIAEKIHHLRHLTEAAFARQLRDGWHPTKNRDIGIPPSLLNYPGVEDVHIIPFPERSDPQPGETGISDSLLDICFSKLKHIDSVYISDYYLSAKERGAHEPRILITFSWQNSADTLLIIFELSTTTITHSLLEYSAEKGFGNSGEAYLVGSDHLMRSESRFIPNAVMRTSVKSEAVIRALRGETGQMITRDYRDVKVYSSYAPVHIHGLNWAILSEIDYQEVMRPINAMRNDLLFLSVVISLFILSISIFLAARIVKPIKRLENAVQRFGSGEANIRLQPGHQDEIGMLTSAFNHMASELSGKTAAILQEQENERQRIARELHDGLGQILAGVKLKLENIIASESHEQQTLLRETKENLFSAMDELHRISRNLRPSVLEELGLMAALENLCDWFEKDTRIPCEITALGTFDTIPREAANSMYRICQEGLTNIARHAKATEVQLQAVENADHYHFMLEDNGVGFKYSKKMISRGNGLFNIQERVMLMEGILSIESHPGKGTTLRIRIPKTNRDLINNQQG